MAQIVNELSEAADLPPGDRVKTRRGSVSGTIVRLLPGGRVVWQVDSGAELMALPESLVRGKIRWPSVTCWQARLAATARYSRISAHRKSLALNGRGDSRALDN
jgi:hypothetical protein